MDAGEKIKTLVFCLKILYNIKEEIERREERVWSIQEKWKICVR